MEGEESEQAKERWVHTLQHCWKRSDSPRVYNLNRLTSEACWDPNRHELMEREREAKLIGPGGKCPSCQWMAGSPMHNAQSWPSKQSLPKGPDAGRMGCILRTTVTPVPSTVPGLVAFLHVWNEYLNKWGIIICSFILCLWICCAFCLEYSSATSSSHSSDLDSSSTFLKTHPKLDYVSPL